MGAFSFDVINWMQTTFGEGSRPFFDFFSHCGGPVGWLLVIPLVFWLSGSKAGLRVGFSTAIAIVANKMLKWSLVHPRPYYLSDDVQAMKATSGPGMPSGHAQGVAAQWGAIAYFVRLSWCMYLAFAFIIFTGAARVYYGLHTPSQVAVGWGLGLLTVVAVAWLEGPIVKWTGSMSVTVQFVSALGVTAMIVLVAYGISVGLRGDFQPAPEWKSRWQATADRLVAENDEQKGEFKFVEPTDSIRIGCSFLGYALCGLWLLRIGEIGPTSTAHRCTNVLLGVPMLGVLVFVATPLLKGLVGELESDVLFRLAFPSLVGIVFPSFTSRLFAVRG